MTSLLPRVWLVSVLRVREAKGGPVSGVAGTHSASAPRERPVRLGKREPAGEERAPGDRPLAPDSP